MPALAAAVASVVVRYRRAATRRAQQIKWLAVAGVVAVRRQSRRGTVAVLGPASSATRSILLAMLAIPVAIGVAVLRYRLYDVDRVISRSLDLRRS